MTGTSNARSAAGLTLLGLVVGALAGCASGTAKDEASTAVEYDPWEKTNRRFYAVNDSIDKAALRPLAKGYQAVTPSFMRLGISNFFDNLTTPRSALNNFLQGKFGRGFSEIGRFVFNSTLGIGGLVDVAELGGMQEYEEDFSQTFAVWGIPEGPYVVLPFVGARSLLETVSLPANYSADLLRYLDDGSVRDKLLVLRLIDTREGLLAADRFLEESNDPYITFREAYRQNREYKIHDGDPPVEDEYYDFIDEEFMDEEFLDAESGDDGRD